MSRLKNKYLVAQKLDSRSRVIVIDRFWWSTYHVIFFRHFWRAANWNKYDR